MSRSSEPRRPGLLLGLLALGLAVRWAGAAPKPASAPDLARAAAAGDTEAPARVEEALSPLFERKDLFDMTPPAGARAVSALLTGTPSDAILWNPVAPGGGSPLLVLAIDLGSLVQGGSGGGYVAYAIAEQGGRVSWYHDAGRRIVEQGGRAWHPLAARLVSGEALASPLLIVEEAPPSSRETAGLLLLGRPKSAEGWTVIDRKSTRLNSSHLGIS